MNLHNQLRQPLRYPDTKSREFMTRRAWWLVVLSFILPGTAQILAGKRRLGRIGISATLIMLLIGVVALCTYIFARDAFFSIFFHGFFLLFVQVLMIAYGVLWLILGLDALRLTRLVRLKPLSRPIVALVSLALTLIPSIGAWWGAYAVGIGNETIHKLFVNDAPAVSPVNGRYNILLLGTDAGPDREGMRADSISLVSVDAETGQSVIIGLPRELQEMPFPEKSPMHKKFPQGFCVTGVCQTTGYLNAVYAETEYFNKGMYPDAKSHGSSPGIEATKDAVEGATGLQVQFYVLINMDSFSTLIDALGGIDVDVKERIQIGGDQYGNWADGYIQPGKQHLNGFQAQWYGRARYGTGRGDYDRMERQRELQSAILAQMTPKTVLSKFQDIMQSGKQLAQTDIPSSMLGRFTDLALKAKQFKPERVELTPPNVEPADPDYKVIHHLVDDGVKRASSQQKTDGKH